MYGHTNIKISDQTALSFVTLGLLW